MIILLHLSRIEDLTTLTKSQGKLSNMTLKYTLSLVVIGFGINVCMAETTETTKNISFNVYATRIGLIGKETASGLIIGKDDIFVALPSRRALHKKIKITYGDQSITCEVLDVGPWHTNDPYWVNGKRPKSETSRHTNKAAIDLSDALWDKLGIPRSLGIVKIDWSFAE